MALVCGREAIKLIDVVGKNGHAGGMPLAVAHTLICNSLGD